MPCATASPRPLMRNISPLLMPGGTPIAISSCFLYIPIPPHVLHFSSGVSPFPLQALQVCTVEKLPKNDLRISVTRPLPLQVAHFFIFMPGFAPVPLQISQREAFPSSTFRWVPKTLSSKVISISIEISLPRSTRVPPAPLSTPL